MPGVHTFESGSLALQGLGDLVGVTVDRINFVTCMFLSIPFAVIYNRYLCESSIQTRKMYPLVIGLSYCWFCFGEATKHLLANTLTCYVLMHISPAQYIHKIVFIFSMSYLTWVHFYRWIYVDFFSIDLTGINLSFSTMQFFRDIKCPFMISVQRMTTLAFSLHDGRVKKEEELSPLQKREAIREVPDILSYLSYLFHFQAVLTGPLSYYSDYMNLVNKTHVAIDSKGNKPDPTSCAWPKIYMSIVFLAITALIEPKFPIADLERTDLPVWQWVVLFHFTIALQRPQYYFAWYLADGIYNLSGFGFNGFDDKGEAKWDLATNVYAYKFEMAQSFKESLDAWNVGTMGWLRRVAFDRAPKKYRTVCTYLLSAWWHGIFMGYYLTFLTGAMLTLGGKGLRRCLRWRFLSSPSLKGFYDVVTFIGTKFCFCYMTYPFARMHWGPGIAFYK
ncbi:hypothetical protein PRIPAC_74041 [Pristionchus pacificus]|uniref:Uncharacterized protein n=1 Tax=Pristionchus pacificus TaxID=54126 RepID=A0A2A6CZR7_PRIPA|nr:hypothetical protein PRIPAC_74041 [Pristionchus pacificus]|eukprot:PDM83523.1 hypothetical protein PRIPAC_30010 [Pristionchus pacificus]